MDSFKEHALDFSLHCSFSWGSAANYLQSPKYSFSLSPFKTVCIFLCSHVGLSFYLSLFVYLVAAFKLEIVLGENIFSFFPVFSLQCLGEHIIFHGLPSLTGWPQGTGFGVTHHGLLMSSGN